MKANKTFLAITLVSGLALMGCGANNAAPAPQNQQQPAKQETPKQETTKPEAKADIKSGVTKMLGITADLKKAIDAGDETKVKTTGPQLEDVWASFEDNVKDKYPDIYKKVEDSLDPTVAGSKASPLNKEALGKLNDQLTQALNELASKEK
jgi:iron uptake system EfeUOB component EfeO/EfeM